MTSLGVGGGFIMPSSPPPPDLVVYARAPLLAYVYRGIGGMQHVTSLGAWGPGLPPIHRLGRARVLPSANTIFNS